MSNISPEVEQQILASIVQGADVLDLEVLRQIEPGYFKVEAYQWFVERLKVRSWEPPDKGFITQLLLEVKDEAKRAQFKIQLDYLYDLQLTFTGDAAETFKAYLSFCVVNATLVASSKGYHNSQRIDYWLKDLSEGVDKAKALLEDGSFRSVDYASDFDNRVDTRMQLRDNPTFSPRILTGISGLDLQFVLRGSLIVNFLAPYKRYKSIFLNSLGFAALLQGFNVLHVTLENAYSLTADRYDTMFSLVTYDRVCGAYLTQAELDNMRNMFAWMKSWDNRLKIVKGKATETTTKDIFAELERLKRTEGFVPDIIIVDYLNILADSKHNKEERMAQTQVVWDLKSVADTYRCPIITASQAKSEAAVAERMSMDHQGKSVGIAQAVDLTIAINQTPQERDGGIIVLSPLVSRAEPITIPEVVLDSDLSRMLVSRSLPELWDHAARLHPYVGLGNEG